jgi:molybdopterin converting factor small subunit
MKVQVKIFPIAGLCDKKQELEIPLAEGSMGELEAYFEERLGVNLRAIKSLMFLHNGRSIDERENVVFSDGDLLWLLPQISGG